MKKVLKDFEVKFIKKSLRSGHILNGLEGEVITINGSWYFLTSFICPCGCGSLMTLDHRSRVLLDTSDTVGYVQQFGHTPVVRDFHHWNGKTDGPASHFAKGWSKYGDWLVLPAYAKKLSELSPEELGQWIEKNIDRASFSRSIPEILNFLWKINRKAMRQLVFRSQNVVVVDPEFNCSPYGESEEPQLFKWGDEGAINTVENELDAPIVWVSSNGDSSAHGRYGSHRYASLEVFISKDELVPEHYIRFEPSPNGCLYGWDEERQFFAYYGHLPGKYDYYAFGEGHWWRGGVPVSGEVEVEVEGLARKAHV